MCARKTERVQDRLTERHFGFQRVQILRCFTACRQHRNVPRTIGNCAEQNIQASRCDVPGFQRQHVGWQTDTVSGQRDDGIATVGGIVKQHHRHQTLPFGGRTISVEQRFQLRAAIRHQWILVTHRARWTYRRAGTATHAQMRIDLDDIAGR